MSTPHNAAELGEIAATVLMPGDPLRAKFIAENYFEDVKCFNSVRNMFGYTGLYHGKKLSVMGSGMGVASIGIYSYELYHFYGVENIIRVGSAGGLQEKLELCDVVLAMGCCTDSNVAYQYELPGIIAPLADYGLLSAAVESAGRLGKKVHVGSVLTTDIFYNGYSDVNRKWASMGVLCVEMESAALYLNAAAASRKALSILSISDHLLKEGELSSKEREIGFSDMIKIALETAVGLQVGLSN